MLYSFYISIIIIVHHFLVPFSNANPPVDDQMLIAFMKGHQETKLSEYSKQKYAAHLGITNFMRKNWQCDKIDVKFEEYERTECQKYRKYLDILYEYLYREYTGIPTVKPKFVFKYQIEIEGPIIYLMRTLVRISQFYFNSDWSELNEYKLNELFNNNFEPKLLNEKRLNYESKLENQQKLPINEMILQLAIDTANECQTNESLEEIMRLNCGEKLEKNLEEMFKKVEERAKEEQELEDDEINDDKHLIILYSKFDDQSNWIDDALFTEFVKGLATNLDKFFSMAKEYSNYLFPIKENVNIDEEMICFGLDDIKKIKKHLTQKYKAYLGVMYLMRVNWNCDKIGKKLKEKCHEYRKHLDILYEYFFQLFVEAKNPKESNELTPLVKPIFIMEEQSLRSLIDVVEDLNEISKCFWQKGENELIKVHDIWEMNLVNIDELNCEMKANIEEKAPKFETEIKISELRREFDGLLKNIYENAKEKANEENEKLEKAKLETEDVDVVDFLEKEYEDKFDIFDSSPFS